MQIPDHLVPKRITRAEVARVTRFLSVPPGTTRDMCLDPDYWVHLGSTLKVDDRIEILAQDGTFDLDLRVISLDPRGYWAQVRLLREWVQPDGAKKEAQPKAWPDADGYRIEWSTPTTHKWRIIDRAGQIVSRGHASEADAIETLAEIKLAKIAA
jgi:hypothetical protein